MGGLKIAGVSGIYKKHDYQRGRYETMPYDKSDIRSVYHTRLYDIWRLKLLDESSSRPDIIMSHDWPNTIEQHGDVASLKKRKPFFVQEIDTETLGSPPLLELLKTLQPQYWFSAHLHVKFAALYKHDGRKSKVAAGSVAATLDDLPSGGGSLNPEALDIDIDNDDAQPTPTNASSRGQNDNPDEIRIDESADEADENVIQANASVKTSGKSREQATSSSSTASQTQTRFLALSKCLQGQDFLQFLDVEAPQFDAMVTGSEPGLRPKPSLRFEPRWMAITKATHRYLSLRREQPRLPDVTDPELLASIEGESAKLRAIGEDPMKGGASVPAIGNDGKDLQTMKAAHPLDIDQVQYFFRTAPSTADPAGSFPGPPPWYTNPQTEAFCQWLGIENKINPPPPQPQPQSVYSVPPAAHVGLPGQDPLSSGTSFAVGNNMTVPTPFTSGSAKTNEEHEIQRIKNAAVQARQGRERKRHKVEVEDDGGGQEEREQSPLRLEDEDEGHARWKEGTG